MPQGLTDEEKDELGLYRPKPKVMPAPSIPAAPGTPQDLPGPGLFDLNAFLGREKKPGMMSAADIGKIGVNVGAGALRGGPPGAAAALMGSAISPETSLEQAGGAIGGLAGPTGGGMLRSFMRAGASGTGAGAVSGLRTGEPGTAALTGAGAGIGETLSELAALVGTPGAARKGAIQATEKIREKFGALFGAPAEELSSTSAGLNVEDILGRIAAKKNAPAMIRVFAGKQEKGGNLATATNRIFTNPKLAEELTQAATTPEKLALASKFADDNFLAPHFIRSKGAVPGAAEARILDANSAYQAVDSYMQTGAFKALHTDVKEAFNVYKDTLQFLNPSEALAANSMLGQGLMKVGVFSSMREAAGMRGALAGASAGFGTNLLRRVWNPEVQTMIRQAAKGKIEAATELGRVLGISAAGKLRRLSEQN